MASEPPHAQPRGGGLSLYANLLEPDGKDGGSASISRAPVVSQQALDAVKEQEAATKKAADSALRFQPYQQIRRPQQKSQKPKAGFPKIPRQAQQQQQPPPPPPPLDSSDVQDAPPPPPGAPLAKSRLADWAATEDDEYMFGAVEKRARGGRRKKKRTNEAAPMETDWDELYDPSRPTNVEEYLRSDERIREVREWKALLYKHRRRSEERRRSCSSDEEEDDDRRLAFNQFAPPHSYSFAPPPPSPPRAAVPDNKTGDDAYARRLALSQGQGPAQAPPPPRSPTPPPPAALPPPPGPPDSSIISREPVRYVQPEPRAPSRGPEGDAMDEDEVEYVPPEPSAEATAGEEVDNGAQHRTNRPGQTGFAARLMAKYGWAKGQGLGAESSGIVQPLRVQVEKRKKKSDAEGGGWAEPGGARGRIIASKTAAPAPSDSSARSKFGPMSNVVVLRNMLDDMPDLQSEIEDGLGQEIGEECGDKYGRVERLYIDVEGRRVYIKFTDQVSALRAVNALDGRVFAGNTIQPQFYDVEKFEKRIYE